MQVEEIRRLNDAVRAKEHGLATQAAEIHRLNAVLLAKDETLGIQVEEVRHLNDAVGGYKQALAAQANEVQRLNEVLAAKDEDLERLSAEFRRVASDVTDQECALARATNLAQQSNSELVALRRTKWFRLRDALIGEPWSLRKMARVAYLLAAIAAPRTLRVMVGPQVARLRARWNMSDRSFDPERSESAAYAVRLPQRVAEYRVRVVHVLANFMTGGSSRLVVDLIENLGHLYEQHVLTSYIPSPPAYIGLDIAELRGPADDIGFEDYFSRTDPAFIHIHYWGDCDEPWYAKAIRAAEKLQIPIVENVNTPVAPYLSPSIKRYVYVSEYVRRTFGQPDPDHMTIHPGSDFSHFRRPRLDPLPDDSIGMVYRLESDKLNERAIEPFIRIVQRRPGTMVLIVGGGSLLPSFRNAVESAGVADRFEFTGYVSYESLPAYYRRLSLFIAPVWKESFGQVSLFAMNMRIPVIGYDVGAIGEIVDDPELLAPPADAEGLATIAIRLLDSRGLRRNIGARQRARAQARFSLEAMNAAYSKLYGEMARLDTRASG